MRRAGATIYRAGTVFTVDDWAKATGFSRASTENYLHVLCSYGFVEEHGEGYRLTEKGQEALGLDALPPIRKDAPPPIREGS
jgi:DNA-binding IclR family transcriptional regulator